MNFPSLFWSCIWYFKLNKIDYEFMLPYETNIFKSKSNNLYSFMNVNINSKVIKNKSVDIVNKYNKSNNKYREIKKYDYNIIIQNLYSFYYINNKYHKYYPTNIKENNFDKQAELKRRRKTYFNLRRVNDIKALNNYLIDQDENIGEKNRFTTNK